MPVSENEKIDMLSVGPGSILPIAGVILAGAVEKKQIEVEEVMTPLFDTVTSHW